MKLLLFISAAILGWSTPAWATAATPLTTLHAIHSLSKSDAAKQQPVDFEATVIYRRAGETTLFVQDGGEGIYVWADAKFRTAPGDRVRITGIAGDSFRPIVFADNVTVLHHDDLPRAFPTTFDEMIHSLHDSARVTVRGRILSADLGLTADYNATHMVLLFEGNAIDVHVDNSDPAILDGLLDAEVEVSGVEQAVFDGKMQQTGVAISIPSMTDVKTIKKAQISPWSLPVTQMDEVFTDYRSNRESRRVHVAGTITYYQPGSALVLQSGTKSLWIQTAYEKPLRIGSQANVTGFPDVRNNTLTLNYGEIQETSVDAPVVPVVVNKKQLAASKHIFELVSIQGKVIMEVRENLQDEYILVADGQVFSAVYRHPDVAGLQPLPMNMVPLGSTVTVIGICIVEGSNPWEHEVPFDVLMRTPSDIAVIAKPSMLSTRNLILAVGVLLILLIMAGVRSWAIERKVRRKTAILAALEQRRSKILEDINGLRPLPAILQEITELVTFQVEDAPCWCELSDGSRMGRRPPDADRKRIVCMEIPARSGPSLGKLSAAFAPNSSPESAENEALLLCTRLATLAIETRRLYSDLLRRSEFDLLTDIHNRFSLEKQLDARLEEARRTHSIFGLIYIDLDRFKQINDKHGHHIGDVYLQAVAMRMKRQLRPNDLLARLGGDEFAVLVPAARNRAEVEEIAQRLTHCFDEPFSFDGLVLKGAASIGISFYPESGATRDSLLDAADLSMYAAKNSKRQKAQDAA